MESSLTCSDLPQPLSAPSPPLTTVRVVIPDSSFSLGELPIVSPNESSTSPTDNSIVGSISNEKIGRWTEHEHSVFLEGLEKHGKQWKTIAGMIGTRTVVQVRTHAQKYFQKMERKQIASISSSNSIDSTKPQDKISLSKRKSLSDISSLIPKKKSKKSQRLSLPACGLYSTYDFHPNLPASTQGAAVVYDQ
jgi:SHAQKYF class myb-like DNA-binding protein